MKKLVVSGEDQLLTPGEVAALFRVSSRTVTRWANEGQFPENTVVRTLGGHRRFRRAEVQKMLNGGAR